MKVDLERLRRDAGIRADVVAIAPADLVALLAVVDAARAFAGDGRTSSLRALDAALEPFTPPAPNAEQKRECYSRRALLAERDMAVKAAIDAAKGNPRDRVRDQLADAGVAVQRQFRSDQERIAEQQERIAEMEAERDEWRGMWQEEIQRALDAVEERDALKKELAEARQALDQWGRDAAPRP